jgi:carbon monoxide dehydrogenase subunit G
MDITGDHKFDLSQEKVWEVLHDPRVLATIIPLVRDLRQTDNNKYRGVLFFRVGSIAGTFEGTIELLNIQAPERYDVKVHGSSGIGQVDITGGMRLETQGEHTMMYYHGNCHFGGRIASVGSRVLELSVHSVIQQSFNTLSRYLAVKYKR